MIDILDKFAAIPIPTQLKSINSFRVYKEWIF
jgi:hypothetical protein